MPNWLVPYQFKPGESGNPEGRPKGKSLTERVMAQLLKELPEGDQMFDRLAAAIVQKAGTGDIAFVKEIWNRTDGPVSERVAGHDGGPLIIKVEYADAPGQAQAAEAAPGPGEDPLGDAAV